MNRLNENLPKLSVLMSVYHADMPEFLKEALDSIINQSIRPDEIVLVKDGHCSRELDEVVSEYEKKSPELKILTLEKNSGLGTALAEGLQKCSFDIVARMDADDVSDSKRFEKQLKFLSENPDIDVVSCFLAAFDSDIDKPLFIKKGPLEPEKIAAKFRFRFCINHPASMFRKQAVLKAGNYKPFEGLEDYHLWARMLMNGARMANIGEVLYYHRWQDELLKRRGGMKRAAQQVKLQREFLEMGFVNRCQFFRNVAVRSCAALLPIKIMRKIRTILGL